DTTRLHVAHALTAPARPATVPYPLSLHDALPIFRHWCSSDRWRRRRGRQVPLVAPLVSTGRCLALFMRRLQVIGHRCGLEDEGHDAGGDHGRTDDAGLARTGATGSFKPPLRFANVDDSTSERRLERRRSIVGQRFATMSPPRRGERYAADDRTRGRPPAPLLPDIRPRRGRRYLPRVRRMGAG